MGNRDCFRPIPVVFILNGSRIALAETPSPSKRYESEIGSLTGFSFSQRITPGSEERRPKEKRILERRKKSTSS
jgi:hypothetical protein